MTRTRERHLLVRVQLLDRSRTARAPTSGATIQEAVRNALAGGSSDGKTTDKSSLLLQTRHYSPAALLCLIRCTHAASRQVREAVARVNFVQNRPVRLTVVQTFGNATKARRVLTNHLEDTEWSISQAGGDLTAQREIREALETLAELRKAS